MSNNFAKVKIRENGIFKKIRITGENKPNVPNHTLTKWQNILNITADIMNIPTSLIMKLEQDKIKVFAKNSNLNNPYTVGEGDLLGNGLYCETVAGNKKTLLVEDATKSEVWKDNPDIKLNMISYLGMPLCWDDNEIFGTICVLDSKKNKYENNYIKLLNAFKENIEEDLKLLQINQKLSVMSRTDYLTGLLNRNGINEVFDSLIEEYKRYNQLFSVILFDIDDFKNINDSFGHLEGDRVLKEVSVLVKKRVRKADYFGRWGGDEFIILCPDTEKEKAVLLADDLRVAINNIGDNFSFGNISASFGVTEVVKEDLSSGNVLSRADNMLYKAKESGKNTVVCN